MEDTKSIIIGMGTHKRNFMLKRALQSLSSIEVPPNCTLKLVVCDNEAKPNAGSIIDDLRDELPFECIFLHEPRKGIVFMRNKILDYCNEVEADYLVFIDDDEYVIPEWLLHLFKAMNEYKANAVGGPVKIEGYDQSESDLELTKFVFSASVQKHPTGEPMKELATCNLLLDLKFIRKHRIRFREEFNLLGGEDIFFTTDMLLKGARLTWCNEAVAYTDYSMERLTVDYALKIQTRVVQFQHISSSLRNGWWSASLKTIELIYKHFTTLLRKRIQGNLSDFEYLRRKAAIKAGCQAIFGGKLDFYENTDGH